MVDWVKKVKGLSNPPKKTHHRHRKQYDDYQRDREVGGSRRGKEKEKEYTIRGTKRAWGGQIVEMHSQGSNQRDLQ